MKVHSRSGGICQGNTWAKSREPNGSLYKTKERVYCNVQ